GQEAGVRIMTAVDRSEAYSIIDSLSVRYPPGCWRFTAIELQQWLEEMAARRGLSAGDRRDAARGAQAVFRLGFTAYALRQPASHPPTACEAGNRSAPTPEKPMTPTPNTKVRDLPTASLSLHPQVNLVPPMPPDQFREFAADVKKRGVQKP